MALKHDSFAVHLDTSDLLCAVAVCGTAIRIQALKYEIKDNG